MKITLKTKKLLIIIASVLAVLAILVYFLVAMFGHELPDNCFKYYFSTCIKEAIKGKHITD